MAYERVEKVKTPSVGDGWTGTNGLNFVLSYTKQVYFHFQDIHGYMQA